MGQDVETLDGLGIFPVDERLPAIIIEMVEVVLGTCCPQGNNQQQEDNEALFEHLRKITIFAQQLKANE